MADVKDKLSSRLTSWSVVLLAVDLLRYVPMRFMVKSFSYLGG